MDFSKSIYWRRGGCPPFACAASPRLRFASFTTPSPSLSPFRTHALMCPPFRSCAAPPPGLRPAPPRPHTLRATPLAARARVALPLVPSCVTREGWGSTPRAEGAGLGAPTLLHPQESAGVAAGWTRRPSPLRVRAAGLAWPARRGGRTVPLLASVGGAGLDAPSVPLRTRAGRGTWGWAGMARAEGWAHRPSSRVCGRGGARGAGQGVAWAEGDWGGRAVLRAPAGRGQGDVPSCTPFPRERGGADKGEGADVSSFRAEGGCWGEGRDWGAAAGPRAPYLRAKGAAAVNAGDGRSGWVTYSRVPPFRANVAAVTGEGEEVDEGGGRREERGIGTEGYCNGDGSSSGPCGGSQSCLPRQLSLPVPLAHPFASKGREKTGRRPSPSCITRRRLYGARGPAAAPQSLPSPQHPPSARKEDTSAPSPLSVPPRSRGKGAHEGTSPRPLPAGTQRTARPPQSPSAQATPAQPHAPRPARIRERRDGAPTPPRGPRQPNPTCPALPAYARGRTARPAPPRPRTQGEGRCAHPTARATPAQPPAHARGRVGASTPSARATPARRLRTPPRPRSLGDARGSVRPAQPPPRGVCYPSPPGLHTPGPRRGVCKGEGRTHAKGVHGTRGDATRARAASGVARRVCGRGGAGRNPGGGAAHERKGGHIRARVRKGESDGEGVVNEAKRSRGEAVRVNGGHPLRRQ
ncbi:hypothetical protein EDB85DRAFT_1902068 [Lactarius pseudohatsudake]|nr:hypothetical protein EDB85DRAFT_1902068 [Lactarius pseudohatsudake]